MVRKQELDHKKREDIKISLQQLTEMKEDRLRQKHESDRRYKEVR